MRAMNHPEYRYQPQSPERREAASRREKARHAARAQASPVMSGKDFAADLRATMQQIIGIEEKAMAMVCAVQYMKNAFPEAADEIEEASAPLASRIGMW